MFEEIVRRAWPDVIEASRRAGVPAVDREDAAIEVFVRLHEALAGLGSATALAAWLRSAAHAVAAELRRGRGRRREALTASGDVEALAASPPPDRRWIAEETYRALLADVARLEPDRRAVFEAYALHEAPIEAIARALGIPVGTAYNRLRLARADLRAAMRRASASAPSPRAAAPSPRGPPLPALEKRGLPPGAPRWMKGGPHETSPPPVRRGRARRRLQ